MKLHELNMKQGDKTRSDNELGFSRNTPLNNVQGTQVEFCLFEMGCGIYIGGRDWLE